MLLTETVTQRLGSYFGGSLELRQLSARAGKLLALQRLYEQVAPPSLGRSSRVLQLEQKTLLLAADNSAIAAKLRQLVPTLIQQLRDKGCEVTGIQVRVQVIVPTAKRRRTPAILGPKGRQQLTELSEELADSPLKRALQRLLKKSAAPSKT